MLLKAESITLIEHSNEKAQSLPKFFTRFESEKIERFNEMKFATSFLSKAVTHNFGVNFCTQQYLGPEYLSNTHA